MLVSAVQQPESAICRHISPPPWASLPPACRSPLGHRRAPSWAPCASQRLPTGCFTRAGVHVPAPLAVCPVLSFPCCVHWSTLCTCVSVLPCGEVHRYRFSGLCVYVLICGICFSLSDLLHSVSDSPFTWSLLFSLTCVLKVINIHLKLSPALKFPYLCAILQSATYTLNSITHKERVRRNSGKKE